MYWRFKYRSRFLAAELEETRQLNEQLQMKHCHDAIPVSRSNMTQVKKTIAML